MNNLTADMTRLRSEIGVMRSKRAEFINELKQDVVEMQEGFRNDNKERASKTRSDLKDFLNAHNERAGKTKDELMKFVSDMKDDVFQMQEGFRNANADRKADVSNLLEGFRNDNKERAGKTRSELMTFVSDMKDDVFQMQEGFRNANADRKADVSSLLEGFRNDLEAARRVWFGLAPEEAKPKTREVKETRVEAEPEIMIEETRAEAEPEVIEEETLQEVIPDDLTEIKGIGSGMQKQLYDGGITTYAQLAECTPDDLRRVLGDKFARLAPNAENWIEQAKELAKQP